MMTDVNVEPVKELRTIEIGQTKDESASGPPPPAEKSVVEAHSNFGPDMSGSDEDEASEVDSFILDENDMEDTDQGLEASKFLLAAEAEGQGIHVVDPQTQARLEALLEAAGINKLSSKDGKALSDPEVLRTLTSSVSSALDEAAQALHRMRDSQGQLVTGDGSQLEASGENESIGHRSGSGNVADASEEGESLLSLACSAGYYELAQVLLAMKANVEDRGIKGDCTPLMEAASGGHVDIVRLLLLHNADINAQSSAGNTPLHYGACGGFKEVVEELINHQANVEIHNENGHTPLMEAASAGHVDVAKILLDHGAGINTHSNEFKESALTLACYKGHLDMVKFLLEAGADQEHKTDEMHTALMEASMDGHVEVARLLLDSGAQVNMPADSFESPLTLAACGGHIELASLLIERGANIEEVNDEGYTPLMEAAREGHEDMVALLLSQGADINAQTEETQETALTLACCGGFLEVADFLLRSGAVIELGCSTPLMEAAQEGHLELVSFLLQSGANVEAQTGTGDTALTYACENGHTDVAEALLECGAKLEHESEGGRTPLMKAARAGHRCTVQFLITKGADVNRTTTSNDHTVLSLACAGGHLPVVEFLLQHNADANHKLKDGSTMVIEAAKGGHTQVVKLLLEWPNRFLLNSTTEQLAQLNVADAPAEEPRVPVQGLANIVPPSEPDPQIPNSTANLVTAMQGKAPKTLTKRTVTSPTDGKGGNKICSTVIPESFQQLFSDTGLIVDKVIDKDEKMSTNQATKEEQILRKQQILEELKKVEQELQEKAQAQMLLSAQQELEQQQMQAKFRQSLISPSSTNASSFVVTAAGVGAVNKAEQWQAKQNEELAPDQISDFAKLFCELGPATTSSCTEAYLQQQQNQGQNLQLLTPPPPPPTTAVTSPVSSSNLMLDFRGSGGKNQASKRNGANKQGRVVKNVSQPLHQPPPPPPPPPPPQPLVHSGKGPRLLPLTSQQQVLTQAQPIVFQTEHNGASQSVEVSQIVASTSQVTLDNAQRQQLQALTQQVQQQQQQQQQQQMLPLTYSPLIAQGQAQHEQLLQHMLSQPGLQHQLQMQQITQQVQASQHALQGVANTQVSTVPAAHLSPQQQQQYQHQQQQYQHQQQQAQLLQQHLLKAPVTSGNLTMAMGKQQGAQVRKQRVVQTTTQTTIHQNSVVNVDESLPHANVQALGIPGTTANCLYANVDVDSQTESNHDTALTLACAGGHAELVSLLLAKGADIEHRDKKGFTPLILAATAGHVDVVEIMLDHAAEIEAQSERTKDTPLSLACSGGRYEVVELLLTRGANKEHRNVSDYTPLSLAASGGYVNIIKLLLSHNSEINSRTGSKLGISPLMLAAMNGHTAAVKLLLDMGSDINAQIETNRNTALTLACFQGRHEVVSLLVDRKANIEHRAKTGLTPLMEAASGGYVEVGRVLLDKGADVNAPPVPSSRDTALTIAADKGHYRFVELLLHRGASVDVKNKKGNSPLWLACNGGHSDVVSLLVQADADIDSQDNRKVSCLMAAFRRGHIKVVKWMVKKVTQFPSENEIKRYIATITDKELQKKCNQCADVIVTAKDRQAAEANKNADSLLEEIKQEKEQAALKAEMASKRRERRRERKKKGKQKDEKEDKDKDSGKNSSPEPDGDYGKKDDDDDEEDEEYDSNQESSAVTTAGSGKNDNHRCSKKSEIITPNKTQPSSQNNQTSRLPPTLTPTVIASTPANSIATPNSSPGSGGTTAASARANRDARKKQQKALRENRREASGTDTGLRHHLKAELTKKHVTEALQVTLAKVTTLIESVVTVTAVNTQANSHSLTHLSSSSGYSMPTTRAMANSSGSNSVALLNLGGVNTVKENPAVNGGNKARTKKSNDIIKQSSTTGIGDLDDFGVPMSNMLKNLANGKLGLKKMNFSDKKEHWIDDYRLIEKSFPARLPSTAPSPRKCQKKDEGWKEVVRKNMSKKLSVPANVTARLIGKGGCNINAIREISGAHVEVEKAKGSADRTVTIKGCPDAIRQANNLINAMVEEPDKDISEILARATKSHKAVVEKPQPQKTPVSIVDFAIGTFTVPTSFSHSTSISSASKSPAQTKTRPGGNQSSGSSRAATTLSNAMGPTIGAWQNPVPGQTTPSSPRRSPQKQVTPNSSVVGGGRSSIPISEKTSDCQMVIRQLMFGNDRNKRSTSPVSTASSSASLTFTATATTTIRGLVSSTSAVSSTSLNKGQDPRLQNQLKPGMTVGNPSSNVPNRFPRPNTSMPLRMEPMPLPIVTSGSSSHGERNQSSVSPAGQPPPGEYSPFNDNLFTNFLAKKDEQMDKLDFASVAAAGVVTTSPSSQTTSNPTSAVTNSSINVVDPALQAKAPGYKIPQRGNSPPYRPDVDSNMGNYRIPAGVMGNPGVNTGMRPGGPAHNFMDNECLYMLRYQQLGLQDNSGFGPVLHPALMSMDIGARGMAMHHGLPQGMAGMPMPPGQQQLPQKEEYSKPHRPMTLPEIKGALNPNAPEFQLPGTGQPLMNGFDPSASNLFSNMIGLGRPAMNQGVSDGPSPNVSPHPGGGNIPGLNPAALPPMMQQPEMNIQYLLQQVRPAIMGVGGGGGGGSPPQLGSTRLSSSLKSGIGQASQSHGSPPQGLIGPSGLSPGGSGSSGFLPQGQPQRTHSPMQNVPGGRPNSAPSVQPDPIGAPRSGSPLSTGTPPLEQTKHIQPIGGERKRGTGRPGPAPTSGSYGNLWSFNSSSVPAASMVYPHGIQDPEEEGMEYGMQTQGQYNDGGGIPTADGDHNDIGHASGMIVPPMYTNGPYPMGPMFPPKGGAGDSHTPPLWNSNMTSAPSDQGDNERWQSWSQQAEM